MDSPIGDKLGPYTILELLGAGGMAKIYKAHHEAMGRYVAIKVLPQQLAHDASIRARFELEVRTIARLEHRYILPVYDVGQDQDISFMVMRYVEGGTLGDLIAAGPLPISRTVEIISQVGEALGYAHRQGVIHRDIKPQNILLDYEGTALLSDFGIAKVIIEGTMQLTSSGMLVGTPFYMAPEQVNRGPIDFRADIYSLGIVLYEMLTGRRPFTSDTPISVALMHVQDPLPPPRQFNPSLPPAVEQVLFTALAKDPDARYQSAEELAKALKSAAGGSSQPETLTFVASEAELAAQNAPAVRPRPQRPLPGGLRIKPHALLGGALAGAVLLVVLLVLLRPFGSDGVTISGVQQTEEAATQPAPSPSAEQQTAVVPTQTARPTAAPTSAPTVSPSYQQSSGEELWRFQAEARIHTVPAVADGLVYVGSDGGRLYALDSASGQERWSAYAKDAIYSSPVIAQGVVYFGSWDSYLYAVDAKTGQELWSYQTGDKIWVPPAVADGVVYVGSDDGTLHAVDAESGEHRWTYVSESGITGAVATAGDTIYAGGPDGLYALSAYSGELQWHFETKDAIRARPLIADGTLYVGSDDGWLYALDSASGQKRWSFETGDKIWSVPALADGLVYFASWDYHIYAVEAETGQERWNFKTTDKVAASPVIRDGVLYIGSDAGWLYALDSASGQELWAYQVDGFAGTPTLADGTIYFSSDNGYVYALR